MDIQEQCSALVVALDESIVTITDDSSFQAVCQRLKNAAANIKAIEEHIEPIKKQRYNEWKRVTAVETRLTQPFVTSKARDSRLVGAYMAEVARKAAEETRRQQTIAEEAARKQREAQAEQLAAEGRVAEGVAVLENTEAIPEPCFVAPAVPKVSGVSVPRTRYTVEVVNLKELVAAVAAGKASLGFLEVNQSNLNKSAEIEKDAFSVPGCKVHKGYSSSVR
jgi:putative sterol carrier protein